MLGDIGRDEPHPVQPERILRQVRGGQVPQLRRLAGVLGTELSLNLAQLWCAVGQKEAGERLESIVDQGECVCIRQLAVTGKELQQLGFSKGPSLGKMLEWLLELVMEGKLENTKEALLAFAAAQQKKGC